MSKALFGAGCYWGIEEYFSKINGVNNTAVGYSGGNTENPTYEEVCQGDTEHVEVVEINFDENIISYENLLEHFWNCHDPTQLNRQGPDVGRQYRSVIFYYSDNQKNLAELSKKEIESDVPSFANNEVKALFSKPSFFSCPKDKLPNLLDNPSPSEPAIKER